MSVVIATFNGEATLRRCLDGIFRQDYPADRLEVIAIDGGSTDGTLAILREFPVVLMENRERLAEGPGMGKAQATRAARGDVVVYVDQDNLVTDRAWLRSLVAPFTEDPELEVLQGLLHIVPGDALTNRYLSAIGIEDPFAAHRSLVTQSLVRPGRFERGRRHLALALDPRRVLYGGNNGCAWRRATLEGLGGYTQDTDLFALLARRRARVAVAPDARLHHASCRSFGHFLRKRAFYFRISILRGGEPRPFQWTDEVRLRHLRFGLRVVANLLLVPWIPAAAVNAVRTREPLWLLHPFFLFAVTWTYVLVAGSSWRRISGALAKLSRSRPALADQRPTHG